MSRVGVTQADLFASPQPDLFKPTVSGALPPLLDPLNELQTLLDRVQGASVLPWQDVGEAMVQEQRALWLAEQAGDEGAKLVTAIFQETERLFSALE